MKSLLYLNLSFVQTSGNSNIDYLFIYRTDWMKTNRGESCYTAYMRVKSGA